MVKKIKGYFRTGINRLFSIWNLQVRRINAGLWDLDQQFLEEYKSIQDVTVVKIDRAYMLYQFARMAACLPKGNVAQLGVYKGGTAKMIARCFARSPKKVFLFDTFEGLPPSSLADGAQGELLKTTNEFVDVSFDAVKTLLAPYSSVVFKQGFFPETTRGLEDEKFCFVYLDADLYQSTKDGLNFFYPRMVPGGIIMLDDFGTPIWPGIQKAVEEFCREHNISPIQTTWWQGAIIKAE